MPTSNMPRSCPSALEVDAAERDVARRQQTSVSASACSSTDANMSKRSWRRCALGCGGGGGDDGGADLLHGDIVARAPAAMLEGGMASEPQLIVRRIGGVDLRAATELFTQQQRGYGRDVDDDAASGGAGGARRLRPRRWWSAPSTRGCPASPTARWSAMFMMTCCRRSSTRARWAGSRSSTCATDYRKKGLGERLLSQGARVGRRAAACARSTSRSARTRPARGRRAPLRARRASRKIARTRLSNASRLMPFRTRIRCASATSTTRGSSTTRSSSSTFTRRSRTSSTTTASPIT